MTDTTAIRLRPSSSHRWSTCTGSALLESLIPDKGNKYADEGIIAHELAQRLLSESDCSDLNVTDEMFEHVKGYVDYLKRLADSEDCEVLMVEKTVDITDVIPNGTGTADAIILETYYSASLDSMHVIKIIDLKYGLSKVEAKNNTQLLLYAIGAVRTLQNEKEINKNVDDIVSIELSIYQPRLHNYTSWTISYDELRYWEGYLKAKAEEALSNNARLVPSESACKYCKAISTCPAAFDFTKQIIDTIDATPNVMNAPIAITEQQTKEVLDKSKLIMSFIKAVEERAFDIIYSGGKVQGYKLVNGKKVRKLKVETEQKLVEILGEKAYNKTLVGVTELEKLIDKDVLESLVYITNQRPLLVQENDKRQAMTGDQIDFQSI